MAKGSVMSCRGLSFEWLDNRSRSDSTNTSCKGGGKVRTRGVGGTQGCRMGKYLGLGGERRKGRGGHEGSSREEHLHCVQQN